MSETLDILVRTVDELEQRERALVEETRPERAGPGRRGCRRGGADAPAHPAEREPEGDRVTAKQTTRARNLRRQGWTLHKIAQELAVSADAVRSVMYPLPAKSGREIYVERVRRHPRSLSPGQAEWALALREDGLTYTEIAERLDRSESMIWRALNGRKKEEHDHSYTAS